MRLQNYYTLITKQNDCIMVNEYNTLEELLNNIDLSNKEELCEYQGIEILHEIEYYDGSFDHKVLYQWTEDKCITLDEELTNALKTIENNKDKKIGNDRLRVLLFNAIVYLENNFDDKEQLLDELGMTNEEYKDIMGEE